jgi:RNA polymerase sigma factor (sigma-70 family)
LPRVRHIGICDAFDRLNLFPLKSWSSVCRTHLIVNGPEKQVEETELIKMMLAHLSLQHRTCLVLQIEGFSLQEISELAGMSEKNVSVSISRAREQCRQFFQHVRGELA